MAKDGGDGNGLDIAGKIVTFPKSEFPRVPLSFPAVRISGVSIDTSRE